MLEIYYTKIDTQISDEKVQNLRKLISAEKNIYLNKFRFKEDVLRSLFGEIMVRYAVGKYCNIPIDDITITKNEYGKPYIANLPVYFNISHSGSYVVCAVGNDDVGIDIEKISESSLSVAKNFFSASEYEYLLNVEDGKKSDAFFDLWTLKESYIKWLGKGLSVELNSFSFEFNGDRIKLFRDKDSDRKYDSVYFKRYRIDGYKCSVCSKENLFPMKMKYFSIENLVF